MIKTRIPLKRAAVLNARSLPEDTPAGREFRYIDISQVDSDGRVTIPGVNSTFGEAPTRARRLAPKGAVAISTVRTYLRAVGQVPDADDLVWSTGFAIAEARPGVDPRFLYYACRSEDFISDVVARSTGVSFPAISPGELGTITMALPDCEEQRRIADFLDDQVARIDRIIDARLEQVDRIEEARRAGLIKLLARADRVPLRRIVREAVVGIVVQPAALYTEEDYGVPALRGLNVREAKIDMTDLVRITPEGHANHPRSRLTAGDVVVVRTGDAGAAAVVSSMEHGWNCVDLVIVRAAEGVSPDFIECAVNAARLDQQISTASAGSIQQHFGVRALLSLSVPNMKPNEQRRVVSAVKEERRHAAAGTEILSASIGRLAELKRSLITAAVLGEFVVSSTSGRGIPS